MIVVSQAVRLTDIRARVVSTSTTRIARGLRARYARLDGNSVAWTIGLSGIMRGGCTVLTNFPLCDAFTYLDDLSGGFMSGSALRTNSATCNGVSGVDLPRQ